MKTKQETFDIVAKCLIEQGELSYDIKKGRCMYRGPNGNKCAAGHLIPDDKYIEEMESHVVYEEPIYSILKSEGFDPYFVRKLQIIHDQSYFDWEFWKEEMIEFALGNNLSTEVFNIN